MNRQGSFIQTYSGKSFYYNDIRLEDIDIHDIAHALSNQCRYNGHCQSFYSVAQHSVLVSEYLADVGEATKNFDKQLVLTGLLHDATEAYLGDCVTPLKDELPNYQKREDELMGFIARKYDLVYPFPADVILADKILLATEFRDLLRPARKHKDVPPLDRPITTVRAEVAEQLFLNAFRLLTK